MRRNTSPSPTSDVQNVERSNLCLSSTERKQKLSAVGLGIVTVSNAAARRVPTMGPLTKTSETHDFGSGERTIRPQLSSSIGVSDSPRSMDSPMSSSLLCERLKLAVAQFVVASRPAYSSIIAISRDTSGRSCAKRATLSSAGTSERLKQSYASRGTSRRTLPNSQPCHADVLLELANRDE